MGGGGVSAWVGLVEGAGHGLITLGTFSILLSMFCITFCRLLACNIAYLVAEMF